jgi:iduronate 2-sulfatase
MKPSSCFSALFCALILSCVPFLESAPFEKPNILFIAIDDLNDWVGCLNGHPNTKTPNIDRLASRGVLFANAHCQAPICGPSRASIFTGLYPASTGIYLQINDRDIKTSHPRTRDCDLIPDYFESFGYKTIAVGKLYHKGDDTKSFGEYGGRFDWMGPKPVKRINYDPAWYDHKVGSTQTDWGAFPENDRDMTDFKSAKWAVSKLEEDHEKPFLLAVGFVRPHVPWYVPEKWFDHHPLDTIELPPYMPDDFDDIPEGGRLVADVPMMPTTEELIEKKQWKEVVQAYLSCITWTDHQVGKLLDALDASPYADNTIIMLWSDHGYHLGEKNRFAKQAIWERDTHVPLIVAGPGIGPNRRCDKPVGLIDMYPTLVDLCALPANSQNEGRSLRPLIADVEAQWDKPAITAYGPVNFAIRSERYRYMLYEDGSEELYDMRNDPNEWKNLATDKAYRSIIAQHRKHIPRKAAPLAPKSSYDINEYFIGRLDNWKSQDLDK